MKWTTMIRKEIGVGGNHSIPVCVDSTDHPPRLEGECGGFFTRTGIPITYPSAYARKGWSSMRYVRSSQRIIVGVLWISQHIPQAMVQITVQRLGS